MTFLVTKSTSVTSVATALPKVAPTPAPLTHVVGAHDVRFTQLIGARGANPAPTGVLARALSSPASWIPLSGAAAALVTSPSVLLFGWPGYVAMGVSAGAAAFAAFCMEVDVPKKGYPSPLALITRHRHLKADELTFAHEAAAVSPLAQATMATLAKRWLTRVDDQKVVGDQAFTELEDLIAKAAALPAEVRQQADAIVALHDAMLDPKTGRPWRRLDDATVENLVGRFQALPDVERAAAGPELMARYFKNEVPRLSFESNPASRKLYRALRECRAARPDGDEA